MAAELIATERLEQTRGTVARYYKRTELGKIALVEIAEFAETL